MKAELTSKRELHEALDTLVTGYGLPAIAFALMQICDDKAHEAAITWQDSKMAKHWAACANAAVDFERHAIREFCP